VDGQDGVAGVVLAGQHHLQLLPVEGRRQLVRGAPQVLADLLPFPGELDADLRLLELPVEGADGVDLLGEAGAALQGRLGLGGIAPQIGIGGPRLDPLELAGQ